MKGTLITLEPLDIPKHAKGYFEMSQDENIHKFTGNIVPKHINETIDLLEKYEKYFLNWMIISSHITETSNLEGFTNEKSVAYYPCTLYDTDPGRLLPASCWR